MTEKDPARAVLEDTRQWAADELKSARDRATRLREGGEAYNHALSSIDQLTRVIDSIDYMLDRETRGAIKIEEDAPKTPEPAATEPEISQPEPEPEKPARVVDLAEVRTKAKAARDAGVKLAEIWATFNATKLSEVPHEKYGDVLDLLEEKLKELDG